MTDAQKRLADVRASITQILNSGQRIRKADREVQRAELAQLRDLETQYLADVNRETVRTAGRGRNRISYVSI